MSDIELLHRRADGTFVIRHAGHPYHVTAEDPMFPAVAAAAETAGELPPETVPVTPPPAYIAKTTILRRATDAEIDEFETWLIGAATARQRLMWQDAEGGLVEIAAVRPIITPMFGEARAAALLAPA
jgi:hypothetical protein